MSIKEDIMGLDMYLQAKESYWDHMDGGKMKKRILEMKEFSGIECQFVSVEFNVIYWRKANQIHGWFVEHVQHGEDNGAEYYVGREQLQDLLDLCKATLKTKNPEGLPPVEGFFFGDTEVNEWYWKDIEKTIEDLDKVLKNEKLNRFEFYYNASW
jgi:hypothetical protein